jgi:Flp pilus assembly protein TadD
MKTSSFMLASWAGLALAVLAMPAGAAPGDAPSPSGTGLAGAFLGARHAQTVTDSSAATAYLDRALQLDPANVDLLRESYFVAAQAGNFESAVKAARKFLETGQAQRSTAPLLVALDHTKRGEYDKAWALIESISGQGPVAAALPFIRAWAQAPLAPADTALAELTPLQSRDAASDVFNLMSGLLNDYYGRKDDALIHYDALADRAQRLSLSSLRLVAAGYHRLGAGDKVKPLLEAFSADRRASFDTDDFLAAFADPRTASKKVTPAEGMAEAMFLASQIMLQNTTNGFYRQLALVYGQLALHLNPELGIARWVIGATAAVRGALDESNQILSGIGRSEPGYLAAQLQIADNLERMERKGDALALLQSLAKERPTVAEIHVTIGDLLRRDEKFADAVEAYDRAFKLYPGGDPDNWILYYTRGIALERAKMWDRAEADFKKALEINPEDPSVLNYLGYSWLDRNENLAEARRLIEMAYKKRPDDGSIVDSLGWAMYLMGEYAAAVVQLEKAVELQPSDPTINEHLGDVYWKVGRRNEARFQWRRAISLATEEAQKTALRAKLEQGLAQN